MGLEIWAWLGFGVAVVVAYMVPLVLINELAKRAEGSSNMVGSLLLGWTGLYTFLVTWSVATGKVPFIISG